MGMMDYAMGMAWYSNANGNGNANATGEWPMPLAVWALQKPGPGPTVYTSSLVRDKGVVDESSSTLTMMVLL